jgi:acyl-homoserine-lactone acylase
VGRRQSLPTHHRDRAEVRRQQAEHPDRLHLLSLGARASSSRVPGTKKWCGTNGNSFVAVVDFGPRIHARAVTAGGESGTPSSPHFNDEAERYATGDLRTVYFYREQLKGHTERRYRP